MLRLRRAENERLRARELAEEELRLARRFGAPRAVGVALRTLALTHSDIERERLLAESAASGYEVPTP